MAMLKHERHNYSSNIYISMNIINSLAREHPFTLPKQACLSIRTSAFNQCFTPNGISRCCNPGLPLNPNLKNFQIVHRFTTWSGKQTIPRVAKSSPRQWRTGRRLSSYEIRGPIGVLRKLRYGMSMQKSYWLHTRIRVDQPCQGILS